MVVQEEELDGCRTLTTMFCLCCQPLLTIAALRSFIVHLGTVAMCLKEGKSDERQMKTVVGNERGK